MLLVVATTVAVVVVRGGAAAAPVAAGGPFRRAASGTPSPAGGGAGLDAGDRMCAASFRAVAGGGDGGAGDDVRPLRRRRGAGKRAVAGAGLDRPVSNCCRRFAGGVPAPGPAAATAVVSAGLLVLTVFPRVADARAGRRFIDLDLDVAATALPLEALRFVEANGLRERMYNDFEIGSYLLFEGYPRYRVFVDPRLPAYPEEMHRLLGSFDLDRATWGAAMDRYGVQTALLAYAGLNRRVAWWDPDEWALVFRADDSRVFVRRREQWRSLIAAHEVPATFDVLRRTGRHHVAARSPTETISGQRLRMATTAGRAGVRAGRRAHRARAALLRTFPGGRRLPEPRPPRVPPRPGWGRWKSRRRTPAHALTHLDRALALTPDDTRTRANRATVLERLGRRGDAAADWAAVAMQARGTPVGKAAAVRAHQLSARPDHGGPERAASGSLSP